jgi:menaquinone-9 beta-reductase
VSVVDADVIVAGGGLAGATTALLLQRAGLTTIVVDKAEFPRDKPCGEGLLPHGVETLQRLGCGGLLENAAAQRFVGIRYHCQGVVADGDFVEGVGRGVRRRSLDEGMRAAAAAAGAQLVHGSVERANENDHGATLHLRDGRALMGKWLIGADGPRSVVRHSLGLDGGQPTSARYALRQHFTLPSGATMPTRVEVHMSNGFELYITPCAPGTIGIAALLSHERMRGGSGTPAHRMLGLCQSVAAVMRYVEDASPASDALACGPLRVRALNVHTDRSLLVGDAAGYVDAITGEGMSLALKTAQAASDAVVARAAGDAHAFARYRRRRAGYFFDHAVLTHGLVWLSRHPFLARRAIARLAHEPALFSRLLSVNNGTARVWQLLPLDALKLAVGKRPMSLLSEETL